MRQSSRLYGPLEPPRNLIGGSLDDPPIYPGHAPDNEVRKLYVAVAAVGLGLLDVPRLIRSKDHVSPDGHDAAADVLRLEGADLSPAKRAEGCEEHGDLQLPALDVPEKGPDVRVGRDIQVGLSFGWQRRLKPEIRGENLEGGREQGMGVPDGLRAQSRAQAADPLLNPGIVEILRAHPPDIGAEEVIPVQALVPAESALRENVGLAVDVQAHRLADWHVGRAGELLLLGGEVRGHLLGQPLALRAGNVGREGAVYTLLLYGSVWLQDFFCMAVYLAAPGAGWQFLCCWHGIILLFGYKNNSQRTSVLLQGCSEDDTIFLLV